MSRIARSSMVLVLPWLLVAADLTRGRATAQQDACIDRLTDAEVRARIDSIQRSLDEQARPARAWWYGWMTALAAIGGVQTALALRADDTDSRASSAVSATGSFIGSAGLMVRPAPSAYAGRRLRRAPGGTPEDRRAKLRLAEELLERAARRQAGSRGALHQLQLVGWLAATGVLLGGVYEAWAEWGQLAGGSVAVFQARVFTKPTSAIRAWEAYRFGSRSCMAPALRSAGPRPPEARRAGPKLGVAAAPGGIALQLRF